MRHEIGRENYAKGLDEIGQSLGLTRERVRQIQNIALKKMRAGFEERGFTAEEILDHLSELSERGYKQW